jgi:hypothetical protein
LAIPLSPSVKVLPSPQIANRYSGAYSHFQTNVARLSSTTADSTMPIWKSWNAAQNSSRRSIGPLEQIDPVVWNIAAIAVVRRNAANPRNQPRPVRIPKAIENESKARAFGGEIPAGI